MAAQRAHGAYIYCRYSTEHQHSIGEQVDACTRLCGERGLPVLGIYPDEAVSGTKLSRTNFDRMMADLRDGMADTVVIYDQSRLMRSVEGWFATRKELQALGVTIISATQSHVGGDIRKSDVFMMESIQATYDQMHVLISREKSTNKLHYMARNGEHTGGVPALGYRVVVGEDKKKRLAVEPDEAQIVRRIFAEYAGGKSYRQIIEELNRDGLRTKRGQPFGTNSIHDLLRNRLYIGQRIYGARTYRLDGTRNTHSPEGTDVVTLDMPELAIVDEEIFGEVQRKMNENKTQNAGRPAETRDYPLKGKVFCAECGAAMSVAASKKKDCPSYYYYRCARKNRTHDCDCRPIRCDELERFVADAVRTAIGDPQIRASALEKLLSVSPAAAEQEKIDRLKKQRAETQRKLDNALSALLDLGNLPELRERITSLKADLSAQDAAIRQSTAASHSLGNLTPAQLTALYHRLCDAALTDPAAVLSIVSRVEVGNDTIKIYTIFNGNPPPKKRLDENDEELIEIDGTPSGVPKKNNPNLFSVGDGFGLFLFLGLEP